MHRSIKMRIKNGKRLLSLINKIFFRDKDLFNDFILWKNKINILSINLIVLLIFGIFNILLIGSLKNETLKNLNLKSFSSNITLTNYSNFTKNSKIIQNQSTSNYFKEGNLRINNLKKTRILQKQINTIIIEKEKNISILNLEPTNENLVLNEINYTAPNGTSFTDSNTLDTIKILNVSKVILIIKIIMILISYLNFYFIFKKYKSLENKNYISKGEIYKSVDILSNKNNNKNIKHSKDLFFPKHSSTDLESENKIFVDKKILCDPLIELEKKVFNSKINLFFCVSFFNIFYIFYQLQLLLNFIFQKFYSIDEKTIFIYFFIFYFSILIFYVLHFDDFYVNILLTNFVSFFTLEYFNGFVYKNILLNRVAFFV